MGQPQTHSIRRAFVRFLRRHGSALRLGACFCVVFAATVWVGLANSGNMIWLSNGALLAYLLLTPRSRWPSYFAASFVAEFAGGMVLNPHGWSDSAALAMLNLFEVAIAAFFLRARSRDLPHFTDKKYLIRFIAIAVFGAPLVSSFLFAFIYAFTRKSAPWEASLTWFVTDALGIAVVTPAAVATLRVRLSEDTDWKSNWIYPLLLAAISIVSFSQTRIPVILLVYPALALILLRFGMEWAALATLIVDAVGSWFTLRGQGPIAAQRSFTDVGPAILLQFFVGAGIFMVYAVSTVLDNLRATKHELQRVLSLHELVTENSRDVIILADFDGRRNFVSAAAANWGGWQREELLGLTSLELVHPDDRPVAAAMVRNLQAGGDGGLVECRIQKRNGEYVWVEANLRAVRDPVTGAPVGILNMVRDIAQRKAAEEALRNAYCELETLAVTDGLTGLANRRQFDQFIATEWRRGMRESKPLSMLLIDVDLFKSYNDTYGHLCGDICLKQIAETAKSVVSRSSDLLARFGGEEFAIILPNTPKAGALEVAAHLSEAIRRRALTHSANPLGILTISVGCATMVPRPGQPVRILIERADGALYAAKRNGRNQVWDADALPASQSISQAS